MAVSRSLADSVGSLVKRLMDGKVRGAVGDGVTLAALAGFSVWFLGYYYGSSDMAVYVPLIQHELDPTLLQNDWFVTLNQGLNTSFVWGIAQIAGWIGLERAFLLVHLVERFVLTVGIYALGRSMTGSRLAGFLSVVIAVLSYQWNLGGNALAAPLTTPHTLAVSIGIFGLYLSVRGFYSGAAFIAAAATYVHLLVGMELAALILGYLAFRRGFSNKTFWIPLCVYTLAAGPVLVPVGIAQLKSIGTTGLSSAEYVAIVGGFRAPWHYLPLSWSVESYVIFLVYLASCAIAALSVRNKVDPEFHREAIFFASGIFVLCLLGTALVEWIPSSLILKFQFFRLTVILKLLASLYLAQYLTTLIESGIRARIGLGLGVLACIRTPPLFGLSIAGAGALDVWQASADQAREAHPKLRLASLLAAAVASVYLIARTRDLSGGSSSGLALSVGQLSLLPLVAGALLVWLVIRSASRGMYTPALVSVAVLSCTALIASRFPAATLSTWTQLRVRVTDRIQYSLRVTDDWGLLCAWISRHTPRDAVFVSPPYEDDFRLRAQRAIVVDFKAFGFRESDAEEWRERLLDLTNRTNHRPGENPYLEMRQGYGSLSTQSFIAIAGKYSAHFIVMERGTRLHLPIVYENGSYSLYEVSQTSLTGS